MASNEFRIIAKKDFSGETKLAMIDNFQPEGKKRAL